MTYSLALEGRDLKFIGSQMGIVYGVNKLAQDLDCWLREEFQGDRFHPNYGSTLGDYIGSIISDLSQFKVEQEVLRVLHNYQQVQAIRVQQDASRFSYDEILGDITDVSSTIQYDAILVTIRYTPFNGADQLLRLTLTG